MTSSTAFTPAPFFRLNDAHRRTRRHGSPMFINGRPVLNTLRWSAPGLLRTYASISERNPDHLWAPDDYSSEFSGWGIVELPVPPNAKKKGLPRIVIGGAGISVALLLAGIAQFSLSRRGLKFHISTNAWQNLFNGTSTHSLTENVESSFSDNNVVEAEEISESIAYAVINTSASAFFKLDILRYILNLHPSRLRNYLYRKCLLIRNYGAFNIKWQTRTSYNSSSGGFDSEGSFKALKKPEDVQIIEDGVKADELCTRREYARWLVQVNLLERNLKHRIIPSISLCGTRITAFDDVNVDDPDFEDIQALAEAGVIPSKLSSKHSNYNGSETEKRTTFSPESSISRQDLINWKVQLEYDVVPAIIEQISRTKVGFMDVKVAKSGISPQFFMDMLCGDMSIIRRVFGNIRRFQPTKPSTKSQAAVALTSGRVMEAIRSELSRIETENASRIAEMEEIRSVLLARGDIQKFWDEKFKEEETRGLQVENEYHELVEKLEEERMLKEKDFQEHIKERAALDCQRQLLGNLGEEVNEMSEKLLSERASFEEEQSSVQSVISELVIKLEFLLDAKSILEAEKEAVRILRSWVEDEAKKSQARAKVLEEAGRRWRWDEHN